LKSHPELVNQALANIAETSAHFIAAALEVGCRGVFYATQESSTQCVSEPVFRQFGVPHDLDRVVCCPKGLIAQGRDC